MPKHTDLGTSTDFVFSISSILFPVDGCNVAIQAESGCLSPLFYTLVLQVHVPMPMKPNMFTRDDNAFFRTLWSSDLIGLTQRAPNPPEFAQPRASKVKRRSSPAREYKFGCVCFRKRQFVHKIFVHNFCAP